MHAFLQKRLPKSLATSVAARCQAAQHPSQLARQFCAHYGANASALDHFSVTELLQSPDLWFVSHEQGRVREQWLQDVYPKHIERAVTITDSVLQCGKCKKNSVDYYEKQTRGADEPMTLFAHCLNCGNRWRQ